MTRRQNLHQFHAEEHTRHAASDKAFSRTGPQHDPLEGGKIHYMLIPELKAVDLLREKIKDNLDR